MLPAGRRSAESPEAHSRYRASALIFPQLVGSVWSFGNDDELTNGSVLDEIPEATTQLLDTGEGQVQLAVTTSDLGDGVHNYNVRAGQFLSTSDVQQIIDQAVARANGTRAAIRRPLNSPARVFVTVVDVDGTVLGIWRTPDATLFSYDVSAQKARTVVAFSDPANNFGAQIRQALGLVANQPLAVTARAVGFLSQRFFPPGIDQGTTGNPTQAGPLFVPDPVLPLNDFRWQQNIALAPFGNGITIFPGGIPLYKNGQLVGGVGVSGDGVDQDDYIVAAGAAGFEPPPEIRCDQFSYQNVRLPFVKFPRNPDLN